MLSLSLSLSRQLSLFFKKKEFTTLFIFFFFPSGGNKYSHVDHRHHLDGSICLVRDDTALFFSLSPPPSLEEFEKQLCYKNESIYSRCWIIIALARHNLHIMVPNKASWHKHPLLEKEEKKNGSCCSNCSLKSVRPHCFLYIYIYPWKHLIVYSGGVYLWWCHRSNPQVCLCRRSEKEEEGILQRDGQAQLHVFFLRRVGKWNKKTPAHYRDNSEGLSLRSCCVNPTQLAMIWVESVYVKGDKQKRRTSSSVREDRRSELSVAVHTIRLNEIGDEFREIKKDK